MQLYKNVNPKPIMIAMLKDNIAFSSHKKAHKAIEGRKVNR